MIRFSNAPAKALLLAGFVALCGSPTSVPGVATGRHAPRGCERERRAGLGHRLGRMSTRGHATQRSVPYAGPTVADVAQRSNGDLWLTDPVGNGIVHSTE